MFSCQRLTLLLISAAIAGCSAYNYKCLPAANGTELSSSPVNAYKYMKLNKQKGLPGCDQTQRRHYCLAVGLMYTDLARADSDVYILIKNWTQCETLKDYIVNALRDETGNFASTNLGVNCTKGMNFGHSISWLLRDEPPGRLIDCLDINCKDVNSLSYWEMAVILSCWRYMHFNPYGIEFRRR